MTVLAPRNSIWGQVDHCQKLGEGVYWISTPGHGGLMIHRSVKRILTQAALKYAEPTREWFCYEEDCLYAVALYELPDDYINILVSWRPVRIGMAEYRTNLFNTISSWHPQYLIDCGIAPDPERYAVHLQRKQEMAEWQQRNR